MLTFLLLRLLLVHSLHSPFRMILIIDKAQPGFIESALLTVVLLATSTLRSMNTKLLEVFLLHQIPQLCQVISMLSSE